MVKFLRSAFSFERLLGMAMLVGFVFLYYVNPYPLEYLRLKTFDYYQQLKPREIPPPEGKPVTIIDLDEESLAEVREREVAVQCAGGPDLAGFDAPVLGRVHLDELGGLPIVEV